MLLYSDKVSPRLSYITDFVGREFLSGKLNITTDRTLFLQHTGARINYSLEDFCTDACWIQNHPLLFETGIFPQPIKCFDVSNFKAFFETAAGDIPFDIFAASFYLLSRYEEYLPGEMDKYGRFPHTRSLAHKEDFLHLPLINIWLGYLREKLSVKFPGTIWKTSGFRFLPTYDIDIPWSYLHKGWLRNSAGFVRSILHGAVLEIGEQWQVLRGNRQDPFDSFNWLQQLHHRLGIQPLYFFLMAEKQRGYDKNIEPGNPAFRDLVSSHAAFELGIHPSWQSGDDLSLLSAEIASLEKITKKKIFRSRQHYLRFRLPETFRLLIRENINEEYSMGYGAVNGFRASVASAFFWYDLAKEEKTALVINPFCYMDATSYYEKKQSPHDALAEMTRLYEVTKNVNGLMITLWHNNALGTSKAFKGWREVYAHFLEHIIPH